ncbi:hypothetical protein H0E87_018795 [Populus deltoides]|uniref:Uncharacterized protein n=1 Tax=Populus deltoides TaxID=3696 RepID=A0A8T2XRE6_POPDE|nr:hypothetical protein H0E87_018795 [Populus deltoides]
MVISEFLRGSLRSLSFSAALRIIALKSLRQILTPLLSHTIVIQMLFLFVLRGKGIMTFVSQWKRESYSLERGDVMKVQAGVVGYLINPDDNEKFSAAMLVNPVNTPGKFREYFAAGGENPESSPRDQLDRLFGQQKQGMILKAPNEKLKALSQHASSSKHKRSHEGKGPINLLNQRQPLYSNKFGKFFEVTPNDYK